MRFQYTILNGYFRMPYLLISPILMAAIKVIRPHAPKPS